MKTEDFHAISTKHTFNDTIIIYMCYNFFATTRPLKLKRWVWYLQLTAAITDVQPFCAPQNPHLPFNSQNLIFPRYMVVLYNIGYVVSMKKIYMLPKIALNSPNHIKKTTTMPLKPIKNGLKIILYNSVQFPTTFILQFFKASSVITKEQEAIEGFA